MWGAEVITKGQGETVYDDAYVDYLDCSDGSQIYARVKSLRIVQFEYVHMCNLSYISYSTVNI